jgi:hypothetical protein
MCPLPSLRGYGAPALQTKCGNNIGNVCRVNNKGSRAHCGELPETKQIETALEGHERRA